MSFLLLGTLFDMLNTILKCLNYPPPLIAQCPIVVDKIDKCIFIVEEAGSCAGSQSIKWKLIT